MKVTSRSRRLAKFLSEKYGWQTQSKSAAKCKCGWSSWDNPKFCQECGGKMPKTAIDTSNFDELEQAIKYALGERGWNK